MKRSLITTLVIGVAVAIVVGVLHATKAVSGFEAGVAQLVSDYAGATRVVSEKWQYVRGSALFIECFSNRFPAFLRSH
jgi:hypothetical protein